MYGLISGVGRQNPWILGRDTWIGLYIEIAYIRDLNKKHKHEEDFTSCFHDAVCWHTGTIRSILG